MGLLPSAPVIAEIQEEQRAACQLLEPSLAVILAVGEAGVDPASQSYVNRKQAYGQVIGARVAVHTLEQPAIQDMVLELNENPSVHGIIVQLPLPDQSRRDELLEAISPQKDVDGLHPQSQHYPATPLGIMKLLAGYKIEVQDKAVTVNGANGFLVGRGTVELMKGAGAMITEIDKDNARELPEAVCQSDILVTAVGKGGLISTDMLSGHRDGLVVIDAGVSRTFKVNTLGETIVRTCGDVATAAYQPIKNDMAITPHLGGVGPMTVCALFENVIQAARAGALVSA